MMNHKCVQILHGTFSVCVYYTSSHASPAVYVAMEQGTELDRVCVRLLSPHTIFEPWQIIVLFYLRDLWLFISFYWTCLFNFVIAYLSVSSHIAVYFVVVLAQQPTPQKGPHVHKGMGRGLIFYISIIRPSCNGSVIDQVDKLGVVFCDFEVPETELCKYIRAI